MKNRIKRIALKAFQSPEIALESLRWYDYAGRFCAGLDADYSLEKGTTAGVVAALSPLNTWESQIENTPRIIAAGLAGERLPGTGFFSNKDKALRIIQGEKPLDVLGGDKVRNFFRNLTGDWEAVTIDRHAIKIAGFSSKSADAGSLTGKVYAEIATAFSQAARTLKIAPAEIQALTWCYWREPWN
jgi:hypothetical protein